MPGPSPPRVEAWYNTRMGIWQEVSDKYLEKYCDKLGNQLNSNIFMGQELTLRMLGRKVARTEDGGGQGQEVCGGGHVGHAGLTGEQPKPPHRINSHFF